MQQPLPPLQTPYVYTFNTKSGTRQVEFGPYTTEEEAKSAFQRVYGYWPSTALHIREY